MRTGADQTAGLGQAVRTVALLNLAYFGVEFTVALAIGAVSLFADSIDFLEDALVNVLVLVALGWSVQRRARVGMGLAALLVAPAAATLWMAWQKFLVPATPDPTLLSLTGAGALLVNFYCATLLVRYRKDGGSLAKAAFLSARNDAVANLAIIGVGLLTLVVYSPWPDLVVGLGIFLLNLHAAQDVYAAARKERSQGATP